MYKIYCLNNISPEGLALLTDNYEVTENIDEADAILVRSADMHEMEVPANLKAVARAGAGVNNIPLDKFAEAGIAVFNTPGANANAVKELVLAGMLLASRDIIGGVAWVRDNADDENVGKAAEKAKKQFAGGEILGKTLGVIGLGAIGKLVAQSAEALGMKVIGYDTFLSKEQMAELGVEKYDDKFEALKAADVVIVQMPLIEGVTNNTIAKAELDAMKPTALLVNCSRGEIVNEPDLCAALRSGSIAGAGLDVFWNEPTHVDDEILSCPNVIVSPHSAAQTREAVIKMATMCVNGCLAVCKGKKWPYVADKAVYDHPRWAGADWAEG